MGEIIRHDFGGGNKEEPKNIVPIKPEEISQEYPLYTNANMMANALRKAAEIKKATYGMAAEPSSETYGIRWEHIAAMTPQEAYDVIISSDPTEWSTHPTYFNAVVDRMNPDKIAEIVRKMFKPAPVEFKPEE